MEIFYPPPPVDKCNLNFKNFAAFTLAEILLSLTVIGIVAAIALPSLLGNANERAWETQKKALYTRFSQSLPLLPSLNGYGELVGNLSDCADTNSCHPDSELKDTAAESFIRDGLSKVMKITNICDSEHLSDCGLPDKIISFNGNTLLLSSITTLNDYNLKMGSSTRDGAAHEQLNTKAAAFETVNGENILVYYNPNCQQNLPNFQYTIWEFTQTKMCANFVYDLNGKKGPNTIGKDIGFITALYSTDSSIVSPNIYSKNVYASVDYETAVQKCKQADENSRLPSIDEMSSIFYNRELLGISEHTYWSNTKNSSQEAMVQALETGRRAYISINETYPYAYCVKR